MAFRVTGASSNSSAATTVYTAQPGDVEAWLQLEDGSDPMDFGANSSVDDTNGFRLADGDAPLHVHVRGGDVLWGRGSTGTSSVVRILVRSIGDSA